MTLHPTHQAAADLLTSRGFHERGGAWHRHPTKDDGRPSIIQVQPGGFVVIHKDDDQTEQTK